MPEIFQRDDADGDFGNTGDQPGAGLQEGKTDTGAAAPKSFRFFLECFAIFFGFFQVRYSWVALNAEKEMEAYLEIRAAGG